MEHIFDNGVGLYPDPMEEDYTLCLGQFCLWRKELVTATSPTTEDFSTTKDGSTTEKDAAKHVPAGVTCEVDLPTEQADVPPSPLSTREDSVRDQGKKVLLPKLPFRVDSAQERGEKFLKVDLQVDGLVLRASALHKGQQRLVLVASRSIHKGEELTFDCATR